MKNPLLLFFLLLTLGLTSCAKDSGESQTEFEALVKQSEVIVNVSYQMWSDAPTSMGCDGSGLTFILFMEDAIVSIIKGSPSDVDDSGFESLTGTTNRSGSISFTDLEPGQYTIIVKSPNDELIKVVDTHLGVRKLVNFRF